MKKSILAILVILFATATINIASAKTSTTNSSLASAIRMYKAKNYSQSYILLKNIVQKDPSNSVAYYYLAMSSAQIGNQEEAIKNYEKVLSLSPSGQLQYYATKGKNCLESPDKCNEPASEESEFDRFVRGKFGSGFSEKARGTYEKQKIENLMREMNRNESITPKQFKDYKDFSSQATPSNEEVVAALRTLQQAGFGDLISGNNYNSELLMLTGKTNGNVNNDYSMLNLLLGNDKTSNIDPRLIQSLLTSQMSSSF